jgi:hypothetical protein
MEFLRTTAPKNAYIGVFPTNSFNAQCTYRKNGYLVLLDTGCFELIEVATYVLLCTADQQTKTKALASVLAKYLEENTRRGIDESSGFRRIRIVAQIEPRLRLCDLS